MPDGSAQTVVTPVATTAAVTPPTPVEDPRIAALAKKEQELVSKQQAFAADRDAFKAQQTKYAEYEKLQANALRDPDSFLKPIYGDKWIEKLNEYRLNANQVTPELIDAHVEKRLSAFEQSQKDAAEKARADAKAADEKATADWSAEVSAYVKQNAAEYELINAYEAWNVVPGVIQKHYQQTGKILSNKEAAEQLEKDLEDRARKTKKFAAQTPGERPGSSSTTATLTNGHTASAPVYGATAKTEKERIERAVKVAEIYEAKERARQQAANG